MVDQVQLIPFPLPPHLEEFFAHQLNAKICHQDGAAILQIHRTTPLGKLIHRSLRPVNRKKMNDADVGFFLSVSNYSGDHDKLVPKGRSCFLDIAPEEQKSIIEATQLFFDHAFLTFVTGAEYGYTQSGKQRGVVKKAIEKFIQHYKISPENIKFDTLVKRYQRHKESPRYILQGFAWFFEDVSC